MRITLIQNWVRVTRIALISSRETAAAVSPRHTTALCGRPVLSTSPPRSTSIWISSSLLCRRFRNAARQTHRGVLLIRWHNHTLAIARLGARAFDVLEREAELVRMAIGRAAVLVRAAEGQKWARRETRPADLVRAEALTERLDVTVEVRFVENLIQSRVEPVRSGPRQVFGRHPIDACLGRRRRLPIAMRDSVVRGIDRVDSPFHHGLLDLCAGTQQ